MVAWSFLNLKIGGKRLAKLHACVLEMVHHHHKWKAEGFHDRGKQAMPQWNYILAFVLQLRKIMEILSQDSQIVLDTNCVNLAASTGLLNFSPLLTVGDFRQPLIGTSAFQSAELRGSPHMVTFSWNCQWSHVSKKWDPILGIFLWVVKQPGCQDNLSSPSGAKFSLWSYTFTPPYTAWCVW
jgi:hypothetical protein